MIWNHVAQRTGRLVKPAAVFHANRLGRGDLHVIDPIAIPDWFEQSVGEPERHDALNCVLPQKVVDAEYLVLVQRTQDAGIQGARRFEAMPERLLDHHAAPEARFAILVLFLISEFRFGELLHYGAKESVSHSEIEDN